MRVDEQLCEYIDKEDLDGVQAALNDGANPNMRLHDGSKPLHVAVARNLTDIARTLIAFKAELNPYDSVSGKTPLYYVCSSEMRELFIESGVDINARMISTQDSVLHDRSLSPDMIKAYLGAGSDVNAENRWGWTPLHVHVNSGDIEILKILLGHGADVNHKARNGKTPIDIARVIKNHEVATYLESSLLKAATSGIVGKGEGASGL